MKHSGTDEIIHSEKLSTDDFEHDSLRTQVREFELPFGRNKITEWMFNGMRISYSEAEFSQPIACDWKGDIEGVTMHFGLAGKVSLSDKASGAEFVMKPNQHNMFYGKEVEGSMKVEDSQMKIFSILMSKNAFFDIAEGGNDAIRRFADAIDTGKFVSFSDHNLTIDLALRSCMDAVRNCHYDDRLKKMFLFSKAIEMLVLQAESFNREMQPQQKYVKTDYDKQRIIYARDYALENIENPPTLTELSRIAGINEYKLKRGFKETFSKTVFEYLSDVKLDRARASLLERSKSATEIAFELGYSSLQHFSFAFKKKFGVSPRNVR